MVKWLRLTRGLPGPEALETARRLGLAPEHGDVIEQFAGEPKRSVRPERTAALPPAVFRRQSASGRSPVSAMGPATCYRSPDGTEYSRVFRYPEDRPVPQGRSLHPAFQWKECGDLDPPGPSEPLALPRSKPFPSASSVVIVEGEKCADALAGLAEGFGVLSWLGGSGAVLRTDWDSAGGAGSDPVAGRRRAWAGGDGEAGRRARPHRGGRGPGHRSGRGPSLRLGRGRRHRQRRVGGWEETQQYLLQAEQVDQQECRRLRRVAEQVLVSAERD